MDDFKPVMRPSEQKVATNQVPANKPPKQRFSDIKVTRKVFKKIIAVIIGAVCTGILIYFYIAWRQSIPTPLPTDAVSSLNFEVYYPSRIPSGYSYKKNSATSHNGVLFFKFVNGKKIITVTEQAVPPKSLDVYKIAGGYTALKISIGKAGLGTSVGWPSVIIITDSTLINITSSQGVTKDQVIAVAQKMELFVPPGSL